MMQKNGVVWICVILAGAIIIGAFLIRDGLVSVAAELKAINEKPWPALSEELRIDQILIDRILSGPTEGEDKNPVNINITGPFHIRTGETEVTGELGS